jgi:hypothetical protein
MIDIEKMRVTLDLVEIVRQAGGDPQPSSRGEHRTACPIHGGDNKNGFAIYESRGRQFWRCFTRDCGGGDVFDFMAARDGVPLAEVFRRIKEGEKPIAQPAKEPTQGEILRRLQELEKKQAEQEKRISEIERWRKSEPWQAYHENAPGWAAQEWERAGIPHDWQAFWRLGGLDEFGYTSGDGQRYTTPTLTIPIYAPNFETVSTVRHRLLRPHDPGDKYRPDMVGLGSHPFLADPDLGYEAASMTIVTEGEKKAAVTFLTYDRPLVQVIGVPGKGVWREVVEKLRGQNVVIWLDPDAEQQARQMAHDLCGARVVQFHHKIDDAIVKYRLDRDWIDGVINTGRFAK